MTKIKTRTEEVLINVVVEYTWKDGYYDIHSFKNDILNRLQEHIHKDYPIKRFQTLELGMVNKK